MPDDLVEATDVTAGWAPPVARLLLHAEPADAAAIGAPLGIALSDELLRATESGGWHALHLAPDEWLLIGPQDQADGIAAAARAVNAPLSLVDVSDRTLAIEIAGGSGETLLAAGCPLDLAGAAFPAGACSRTLFGKVPVMLWRRERGFWLEFGRSFADYVALLLQTAGSEFR